jgi:general secretion pathway protein J
VRGVASKKAERGFTLLELLLAVALLAMLMVLLTTSIGMVSHRLGRGAAQLDRAEIVALVQNYLRATLGQTLAVAIASNDPTAAVIDFDGSADAMAFVGRAPASAPSGGLMKLELRFDRGQRGAPGALVVDWKPYRDAGSDETRRGARQLFAGVSAVGFAYFDPGGADRPPGWRDEWHAMPILPTLVKVSVAFADGDIMPTEVVALRLAAPAKPTPPQNPNAPPSAAPPAPATQ